MSSPTPILTPIDRELSRSTRYAFGLGQVAEGLKTFSFGLFVLYYYNSVLGLSGSLCGLAIALALVVDAVSDPLMGSISDNFRSRWGRRHPFMVLAAVPLALSFYGLFAPPAELETRGLFLWLTTFAVLARLMMTVYHVPHISLGAELTANFAERTRLVATRQVFGYIGAIGMTVIAFGYFFADDRGGRQNADAYAPFALVMSGTMLITILASAWLTRDQIPFLPAPRAPKIEGHGLLRVFVEARSTFSNHSFRRLFLGVLLIYILVGTESALSLYMYDFFWSLESQHILMLIVAYPSGMILGALFTARLHEKWGKAQALILGTIGWSVCQLLPVIARLLDWLPPNETSALIATLIGIRLLQGALVQQALASFSSMMGDIADEHELDTGRRQEGIFFGVVSFSGKAASGAGSLVAGIALDLIAWPAGLGVGATAAAIPPETIRNLGIVFGPMVAIFAFIAPFAYRGYTLDRERHQAILAALDARHAAQPKPTETSTHSNH